MVALVGGMLAHVLFAMPTNPTIGREAELQAEEPPARMGRRRLLVAGIGVIVVATTIALILAGTRSDPALWVGLFYMLTWGLLGFAVLGFACGLGRRRLVWLGAALFGIGYMVLTRDSNSPERDTYAHLVAEQLLISLDPWLPHVNEFHARTAADSAANRRIRKALEQTVPMRFPNGTTLEDLLKYVKRVTRTPDGREIPIYVDPIGLSESETSMQATVQIDLEGVSLRTTLNLALNQIRLVGHIKDGCLLITSDFTESRPDLAHSHLILGHCLMALFAAGLQRFPVASHTKDLAESLGFRAKPLTPCAMPA